MGGIELRRRWWYDAGDERVLGEEDGAIVVWVRDIDGRLLTAFKTVEQPSQKSYVYVGDRLIGTTTGPDNHDHIHPDHLGTPRLITDEDGERLAFHEYLPFGFEFTSPYQDDERKKFTGHERDYTSTPGTSFDLDYMHARHYSPSRHRFLSVDPIDGGPGEPQSWNRYSYVINSPLTYIDPFGLIEWGPKRGIWVTQGDITVSGEIDYIESWLNWREHSTGKSREELYLALGGQPRVGSMEDVFKVLNSPCTESPADLYAQFSSELFDGLQEETHHQLDRFSLQLPEALTSERALSIYAGLPIARWIAKSSGTSTPLSFLAKQAAAP